MSQFMTRAERAPGGMANYLANNQDLRQPQVRRKKKIQPEPKDDPVIGPKVIEPEEHQFLMYEIVRAMKRNQNHGGIEGHGFEIEPGTYLHDKIEKRCYREWFIENISSFNPMVISDKVLKGSHSKFEAYQDFPNYRTWHKFHGINFPFDRFWIESDKHKPLYIETDFVSDRPPREIHAITVDFDREFDVLHIGCVTKPVTTRRQKDFVNFNSYHFIIGDDGISGNEDFPSFLVGFMDVLHSLSAMTVIKVDKRSKMRKLSKKEKKQLRPPKYYVHICEAKERKEYIQRRRNQKGEYSHCWEVMGHFRRILGKTGHNMNGDPMKDWTWVKSHWKGNINAPVVKKCRLIGSDVKQA